MAILSAARGGALLLGTAILAIAVPSAAQAAPPSPPASSPPAATPSSSPPSPPASAPPAATSPAPAPSAAPATPSTPPASSPAGTPSASSTPATPPASPSASSPPPQPVASASSRPLAPTAQEASSSREEPSVRLPWYAPVVIPYEDGMPIPPGYGLTHRRRRALIATGAALFGASYLTSALTAATVVAGIDKHRSEVAPLFIPFAGPWITLATSRDAQLNDPDRRMNGVLLVVDGVAQITGAALFIAGMVTREPILMRTRASYDKSAMLAVPEVLVGGRSASLRWVF
ncbi:Vegetative cell wall protein gp1 precursor (Hydroxyproline-rich glycoprotein 1) [Minicystis rosea]|nr:Vegetative cell wall protein gp1 precursor (Hydroxyproline-rich glycoprotein 1) [Minicystis rosea]